MTTPQTDAPTLQERLRDKTQLSFIDGEKVNHVIRRLGVERAEAADALDAHEATIAALVEALRQCEAEIYGYIKQEYPHDHPVQERCRQRDFAANPARIALAKAALKGSSNAHK